MILELCGLATTYEFWIIEEFPSTMNLWMQKKLFNLASWEASHL